MKILFTIGSLRFSGAERVLLFIANSLSSKGNDVTIITLSEDKKTEHDNPLNEQIKVIELKNKNGRIKKNISRIKNIRRIIKEIKPNVVVSFGYVINPLLILSCIGLNTPILISERNDPVKEPNKILFRIIRRITYPLSNKLVVQTPEIKKFFSSFMKKSKISIVPNPITKIIPRKNYNNLGRKIVSVGRLDQVQKNQLLLIYAMRDIVREFSDATLTIYGEGEDRKLYEETIDSLNLSSNIFLPGEVINVQDKVIENDIFVLSSNFEGMPNALIEAMASGMACVSTKCGGGGAEWLINSEENGILVDQNDHQAITRNVISLFENEKMVMDLGKNAALLNTELNQDKIINLWIEQLQSVNR